MSKTSARCSRSRHFRPLLEMLEQRNLLDGVSFLKPASNTVGLSPSAIAMGDFNGGGKADLVAANRLGNSISVLLGNGDGSFARAVNYSTGMQPDSVAVGDFNGDGMLDIVTANFGSNNVSVLRGNGGGRLQPGRQARSDHGEFRQRQRQRPAGQWQWHIPGRDPLRHRHPSGLCSGGRLRGQWPTRSCRREPEEQYG